jgi:Zn-dependent protease with chaperone function
MSNAIALTDSLGQHLNDREMDFVVTHEVAHVKLKHGCKHLLLVVTLFAITAISLFFFSLQTRNLHPLFRLLAIFGPLIALYYISRRSSIRQTAKRLGSLMPQRLAFRLWPS